MTSTAVVAVDVGGTKIRAGSVVGGALGHVRQAPTPATAGREAVLDAIAEAARAVISDAESEMPGGPDRRWRLGIGSAGVIDADTGTVISATDSLAGWAGTRVADEIGDRLGCPTRVVNDVHAHALGESLAGAARGARSSLLVAAGTGIGGAFIAEGGLLRGRRFAAGHIGHVPVAAAQGRPCPCGGDGHVEAVASGPAILSSYRLGGGDDVSSTRELDEAAHRGDAKAREAFDRGGRALGSVLGGLANVLSPEVIVIGGGLAGAGAQWWQPLREAFEAELIPAIRGLDLRPAELGQDAALIGAAGLWSADIVTSRPTSEETT